MVAGRCNKSCSKPAVLGSRCVRHWLMRQSAYRKLPTHTKWWGKYQPGLVAGIEARVLLSDDEKVLDPVVQMPRGRSRWAPLVMELILAADAAWRKNAPAVRNEESRSGL